VYGAYDGESFDWDQEYVSMDSDESGSTGCNNDYFTDPLPGVGKACFCAYGGGDWDMEGEWDYDYDYENDWDMEGEGEWDYDYDYDYDNEWDMEYEYDSGDFEMV
jgi:hypothetical protein